MMMWTKSTINSTTPDTEHGTMHTLRSPRSGAERDETPASEATASPNTPVIHIHEGSAEEIAYKLFLHILEMEEMYMSLPPTKGRWPAHRPYILSTYAQCIRAVKEGKVD